MSNPTFNKYRSTTVYGALKVRDLTNSAGTTVIESGSTDLSGNFLSSGDSTFTKAVVCNANIADINANNKLTTKEYVDTAVSSGGGSSILGLNNTWSGINTYNSYFPISTLPTSTAITDNSIVNKSMNDTIYAGLANNNTFSGINTFTDVINSQNEFNQYTAPRGIGLVNNFIRSFFLQQLEAGSIFKVNSSNNNTGLRVGTGDYPYLPTNSPYTTPQIFTITAQQTIAGSQISITQSATTATNTANYQIFNSIMGDFTIPTNFSKGITLNIPISIRNAGTWTLSGSALQAMITNTINSMTAIIYVNGIAYATNPIVEEQNSNSLTRSTTISYTTTGSKTIALDQYFFNININLNDFFTITYISRDNSITNTLQIVLSANITNTIARVSNTGNFTATNTLTFVSNTGVSTISNTGTSPTTITYSPNSNGTNYATATTTSYYIDATNTSGGTTYTNHLRANTFNLLPAGMIMQYTGSTAPTGWLLCDGSIYNASSNSIYQELFNVIGNQFGGTTNANFKVPDYRGMFLRGAGTNAQPGYTTYTGQTLNTQQTHATQTHTHTINHDHQGSGGPQHKYRVRSDGLNGVGFDIICSFPTNTSYTATGLTVPAHSGSSGNNTGNTDANETRSVSYSVNYLIKY